MLGACRAARRWQTRHAQVVHNWNIPNKAEGPPSRGTQGQRGRGCKVTHYGGIENAIIDVSRFKTAQNNAGHRLGGALPCPVRCCCPGGPGGAKCNMYAVGNGRWPSTRTCTSPQPAPQRGVSCNVLSCFSHRDQARLFRSQSWYRDVHGGQAGLLTPRYRFQVQLVL